MSFRTVFGAAVLGLAGTISAHASSVSITLTADNAFSLYESNSNGTLGSFVGTDLGGPASQWGTTFTYSVGLTGPVEYLHIVGYNYTESNGLWTTPGSPSNPDALIASASITGGGYLFPNSSTSVLTDSTNWKAVELAVPSPDVPANVAWIAPTSTPINYGANGVGPWGNIGGINSSADWIWSDPDNYEYAGFSLEITQTPLPAALPMLAAGMGVLGFFGARRKRKALQV
jgi:hypothetical protein